MGSAPVAVDRPARELDRVECGAHGGVADRVVVELESGPRRLRRGLG